MNKLLRRFRYLLRRDEFARELEEEMRLHVELRARKLADPYAARRQFGNRAAILEESSEMWGWMRWERLAQDLRMAARALRKTPGFTAVAVATLAVGLGINTAIYSVVNAVMVRALPYADSGRLVSLWEDSDKLAKDARLNSSGAKVGNLGGPGRTNVSLANLPDYQKLTSFEGLAGNSQLSKNFTGAGNPERLQGEAVNWNFFRLLGVTPTMGRDFQAEDDRVGASNVAIVTNEFWRTRMGSDTEALGHSLTLDGEIYRVVGVLPRGFQSPAQLGVKDRMQIYVPIGGEIVAAALPFDMRTSRGDHELSVVGRLKPGVSLRAAQAELDSLSAALGKEFPASNGGLRAVIAPLRDDLVQNVRDALLALWGASGLIVLIACVNVANLLLVRAVARRHESSVRLALGASRLRMARQLLTESLLIAAMGCGAGILLGRAIMGFLIAAGGASIPQIAGVTLDWHVFAVCSAIATVTGMAFGMAPAWQVSQASPAESLKTGRTAGGGSQTRWRTSLTVAEVALSMVLLVGAGLLLKSFILLAGVDLGFQPDRVLVMQVNLPSPRYGSAAARLQFFEQLEDRLRTVPGVQAVAYANRMPMRGGWGGSIRLDGAQAATFDVDLQAVSPGYFDTLGIPLLHGRLLTAQDRTGAPPVAVVNQAFARELLQGRDPLGHNLLRGNTPPFAIVGVLNDIRRGGRNSVIRPQVYLAAGQTALYPVKINDLAVRTAGDPRVLTHAIQEQVWALDKDQPVTDVRTYGEIIDASVAQRRFQTMLLVLFAGVAVGLAAVGIFGVLAYSVSQRTRELGLRMALGAAPGSIVALVFRQAGGLIAGGVLIGLAGSLGLTRYVKSQLFGVETTDWKTYAAAVTVLAAIAIVAALIPAARGAKIDPIMALRDE